MSEVPAIVLVQAVYNYKGKNNDELNFRKGDVITITQKDDGGWWEGTLEGKTGWFPSNYVKDAAAGLADSKQASNPLVVEIVPQQQTFNRNLILKDIIDSEKHHVTDLQSFMKTILSPIANSKILSLEEYNQILRNLPEIIELHSSFVKMLEECHEKPSLEQRVGHIFISMAEKMKVAHSEYCSHHPKAVCILESYKDKLGTFVEGLGGKSPGLVFLTAGLSKPFRRLERYGGYMQELERHMEEFHPDRGDSQRSVFLYQNLATHCAAVRRQKEQELEVLCGSVRSWEGEEPHRLGELIYMGPVKILPSPSNPELKDRHLVLFSQCIVLLSVSQRLSAFVFEKKFPLMGVAVLNPQDETDVSRHSFELVVSGSERMTISCPSREERNKLIDLLQKQLKSPAAAGLTSPTSSSVPYTLVHAVPPSTPTIGLNQKPEVFRSPPSMQTTSRGSTPVLSPRPPPPIHHTLSAGASLQSQSYPLSPLTSSQPVIINNRIWTYSCLRPSPPMTTRPCPQERPGVKYHKSAKLSRRKELTVEDDTQLLQLVEAYCSLTARSRQTVKSVLLESPQVLIAEEEKIIFEEIQGNTTVVEEKSLVDTVYALRDQVRDLQNQVTSLAREVDQMKTKPGSN